MKNTNKMEKDIPEYYKGKNGYMAKDVVSNFDLSYNVGTAVTYLLRSKRKHSDGGMQDIRKAINHLHFELEELHTKLDKLKNGNL
jgi:hypothetical protein